MVLALAIFTDLLFSTADFVPAFSEDTPANPRTIKMLQERRDHDR